MEVVKTVAVASNISAQTHSQQTNRRRHRRHTPQIITLYFRFTIRERFVILKIN